jgi:hypothetical protein
MFWLFVSNPARSQMVDDGESEQMEYKPDYKIGVFFLVT